MDGEQDFLVFVEDDGSAEDDRLVLRIPGRRAAEGHLSGLRIQPEVDVELKDQAGAVAHAGLATAVAGAVLGTAAVLLFLFQYPAGWHAGAGFTWVPRTVASLATLGGLGLIVGALLTQYGRRRVQARVSLRSLRVEAEAAPTATVEARRRPDEPAAWMTMR